MLPEPKSDAGINPYVAPPGTEGADKTAPQGPTPRKFAGKYDTTEELEKGYDNQQTVLTERSRELEAERNLRVQLERTLEAVAERMSPADRVAQRSQAEIALEQQGLPLAALDELINERAARVASKVIDDKLAPFAQGARTQEMLDNEFPGISKADVEQFLRSNPEIRNRYQEKLKSNVSEAMYFAYGQYAVHGGPTDLSGQAEQQGRARRDAALPTGTGSSPTPREEGPSLADEYDKYLNTGNKTDFLLKRLGHIPGIKPTQR